MLRLLNRRAHWFARVSVPGFFVYLTHCSLLALGYATLAKSTRSLVRAGFCAGFFFAQTNGLFLITLNGYAALAISLQRAFCKMG
jgi:hypothetical protein